MFLDDATWAAVDPARNAFDTEGLLLEIVAARTKKGHKRRPMGMTPAQRESFLRDLGDLLAVRYGEWTRGWRNSGDEGDGGGGPVRAWCCAGHSWEDDYTALAEKIGRALGEWRAYLEELAALFETARGELARVTDDDARSAVASREVLKIVGHVIAATGCGDAWYLYAQAAVAWFFEDQGLQPQVAQRGAAAAMEGRFSSWIAPQESELLKVSDELGLELAVWIAADMSRGASSDEASPTAPDALVAHCRAAKAVEWGALAAAVGALPIRSATAREVGDVHRAFVEAVDRPRGLDRADGMLAAIDEVEAAALRGDSLDWTHLSRVQSLVLGCPAEVRQGTAFAKGGRERYGHHPQLATALEGKLTAELARGDHPLVAATRAYLDLCFFHPFKDGNARAARLAMQFVLAQGGVGVKDFGPVFRCQVPAGDREAYRAFLAVVSGVAWEQEK